MAKHKEGKVEDYLVAQVELRGGLVRKAKWLCRRGCPDRFVSFPKGGRSGFIEVKAPGEPLQSHQDREIKRLREAGVNVEVVDSVERVDAVVRSWYLG